MARKPKDPVDVGDESQVKKRKTAAQLILEREIEELKIVLSQYAGRAFVWQILEECGVYKSSMTNDSWTFYKEGQRSVGLWLLQRLFEADSQVYTVMRNEAVKREKKEDKHG